ncbi:MAG: hypothetical protein LLG01_12110 [Planctomycetaceae bacterium]|nr:hypothetical protein [Planctomycetaceae bacterium]
MRTLRTDNIELHLRTSGTISCIENSKAGERYDISADSFAVRTDRGTLDSATAKCVEARTDEGEAAFRFVAGDLDVTLHYRLRAGRAYVERWLEVAPCKTPLTIYEIVLGRTVFGAPPREAVQYDTFWNCPTVTFLRWDRGGVMSGIENPFFHTRLGGNEAEFSFEPSLILKSGEGYVSEPQFIGVYRLSGVMLTDHAPRTTLGQRPRFRNPYGHVPIDRSEVRAMQKFALDYMHPRVERFVFILYNFFYPLPQMPAANSPEEAAHTKMIDMFAELGGDLIIFNPMHPYTKPAGDMDAYWDLGPEGSAAQHIMDHARAKGIPFGYYMGCARHGHEGNACALPFAPERPQWKKVDAAGNVAAENCIACDEYADWWFAVQRNTIERFKLGLWSWDPGPGNGCFCYSDQHGHLPGNGAYKGWRSATEILRRLKEEFPGLYYQAFYGRKEHGLWGFKYFDQHESYWELGLWMCSLHSDLHADRMNADGVRQQCWWNQNFRFQPAVLSHAMVHRFQEGVHDTRLTKAWDHGGWKFSVMSCLAAAGSITTVILPEDLSLVPGMTEFYRKWLAWARENFDYVQYNVPFGSQVQVGGVDGYARIKGRHGFIFLVNPGPRPARIEFALNDEIGLDVAGQFTLRELYPSEGRFRFDHVHGRGVFDSGQRVSLVVPAYEVLLLELAELDEKNPPRVFDKPREGTQTLPRYLDDWRLPDGSAFDFPRHAAAEKLVLKTSFEARPEIRDLLAAARPANLDEFVELIPKWKKDYPSDNYAWARPDRLWLVLPFVDADKAAPASLRVNGKEVPVETHAWLRKYIYYADLTDAVAWGRRNEIGLEFASLAADQFLGPYLDYPPAPGHEIDSCVIYDAPLDASMPQRTLTGPADTHRRPVVCDLQIDPPYLCEGVETKFSVSVDLPPEELEGVYLSYPVHDAAMTYDASCGRWVIPVGGLGRAWLIMDVPSYHVWAVAKSGLVSEPISIPLEWRFKK